MDVALGKFRISGAALLALAAVCFFNAGGIAAELIISLSIHEIGHFIALRSLGNRISEFRVDVWGPVIRYERPLSYSQEIITAAAGPAASLLLALAASYAGRLAGFESAYIISGISLVSCVYNLLPAMRMDGGKILFAATALTFGLESAERLLCVTSCIVIGGLLVAGAAILIWTRWNFTLLLAAGWLLISYCKRAGLHIKSKDKTVGCV